MTGQKDGQTLFHRTIPTTAKGLTSTAAVDWHLKVKDTEDNVSLIENYCITVSLQKISSIHKLILKIKQIFLSLMNQMVTTIFDHNHPKIIRMTFSFPDFAPACNKINSFHLVILEIQSILGSHDQTGHTHFWPCQPKCFLTNF